MRIINIFKRLKKSKNNSSREFSQIYSDTGLFTYDDKGFSIAYKDGSEHISWHQITKIEAYKKDQYVTDLICLDIYANGKILTIHEELPGWFQFVLKTKEVFPSIPENWDFEIIQPPFETNLTTIYQK